MTTTRWIVVPLSLLVCGCSESENSGGGTLGDETSSGAESSATTTSADGSGSETVAGGTSEGTTASGTSSGTSVSTGSDESGSGSSTGGGPLVLSQTYGTYFGGTAWERIQASTVTPQGELCVSGSTSSFDFPVTRGAYATQHAPTVGGGFGADYDGFVGCVGVDGTLAWASFLGGGGRDDLYGVGTDATGIYAVGWSASNNYPQTVSSGSGGNMDIVLSKLSLDGGTLIWSARIGGSGIDQVRGAMAFTDEGEIVLAGYTDSPDFPGTSGVIQDDFGGGYGDAVIVVVDAATGVVSRATYLGGSGPEWAFSGVHVHADGDISVGGLTGSSDFVTTAGAYQTTYGGDSGGNPWYGDGFVVRMNSALDQRTFSTLLGGSGNDWGQEQNGFVVDAQDRPVLLGRTESADFPTTPGAYQEALAGTADVFIARLSADGSSLDASTYFGAPGNDGPEAIGGSGLAVDDQGRVWFGGATVKDNLPTTDDAVSSVLQGPGGDAFVFGLSPDLGQLVYGTYLGGTGTEAPEDERGRALTLGPQGRLVVAGTTNSGDFPTTMPSVASTAQGSGDGFVAVFEWVPAR